MNRTPQLATTFSATVALLGASTTMAATVTFGSDNDGLGGFTQSATVAPFNNLDPNDGVTVLSTEYEKWDTLAGSVRYTHEQTGTLNSSLLKAYIVDPTVGNSHTITGVATLTSFYAADNNRPVGLYLFGDSSQVAGESEAGAIGLIFNIDDGSTGGSPGNNADDRIYFVNGIDNGIVTSASRNEAIGDATELQYSQDLMGTSVALSVTMTFVADADASDTLGLFNADIQLDGTMTDYLGNVTTVATATVNAEDVLGDLNYFGFVTRARARNFNPLVAGTDTGRSLPIVTDYKSFTTDMTAVPEPASLALLGLGGLAVLGRRRGS